MANWTPDQNKRFEKALALYDERTPDRWQKVARAVGGSTTVDEVKRRFELLVRDVNKIEAGEVPLPPYNDSSEDEEQ